VISAWLVAACLSSLEGLSDGPPAGTGGDAAPPASGAEDAGLRADAPETSAPHQGYADVVLADRPLAYFRLDETTGNAVNLGLSGIAGTYGANVSRAVRGLLGGDSDFAAQFSSADAGPALIVQVSPNANLQPSSMVSVECWVRGLPTGDARMVSYGDDLADPFEAWVLQELGGKPQLYIGAVGGVAGASSLAPSTTYHLVGTYDGAAMRLYVNGQPDGVVPATGVIGPYDGNSGLGIGRGYSGTGPTVIGVLDEVAVYGTALPADRVLAHYEAGR
jgi:hypothetical protein